MHKIEFWAGIVKFEISGEDVDDTRRQAADVAANAPAVLQSTAEIVAAARAIKALQGDVKPDTSERPAPPVNKGVQPGKSDVPNCECGIPMTDVRGKQYQKGPKKGQNYPFSFYRSNDCKNNCEARN